MGTCPARVWRSGRTRSPRCSTRWRPSTVGRVQDPVGGRGRGAGDARVGDELLDRRLIGEEGPEGVLAGPLVDDHELAVRVLGEDMADGAGRYSSLAELEHRLLVPAGDHLLQRRRGGIELRDDYDAHFVLQS